MVTGKCALCDQQKKFCKAHIIPISWKSVAGGQLNPGDARPGDQDMVTLRPEYTRQGAHREFVFDDGILCGDCDRLSLGPYDKAFVEFGRKWIVDPANYTAKAGNTVNFPVQSNVTSNTLIIGVASILWRAHLSTRFPHIKLGRYAQTFKEWINTNLLPDNLTDYLSICVEAMLPSREAYKGMKEAHLLASPEIGHRKYNGSYLYELFLPALYFGIRVGKGDQQKYNLQNIWLPNSKTIPLRVVPFEGSTHAKALAWLAENHIPTR